MSQYLQIFMEYKIRPEKIAEYERLMEQVIKNLPEYGAYDIQWFIADDQPHLYVEMFKLPTQSHFMALKKIRQSETHHLFGKIAQMVEGGCEKIHCWAFHQKTKERNKWI